MRRTTQRAIAYFLFATSFAHAEPWRMHVIDDSSRGADGVRLADFNADGKLDIVTGWEQGGITRVYLQPAVAHVQNRWPAVTVGGSPSVEDAVAVDLDQDGDLDVVSSTEGKSRTLFVHWFDGKPNELLQPKRWTTEPIPASKRTQPWMYCLPSQVDGQRTIDLITGSKDPDGAVGWWEAPEDPRDLSDWKYHAMTDAGWIMSLAEEDIDGDGDLDVIISDRKGPARSVRWLEHPGAERIHDFDRWISHEIGSVGKEVMFLCVTDMDRNGTQDYLAITRDGVIDVHLRLPGDQIGWSSFSIELPFGLVHGKSITLADFDRDTRPDLITTSRSVPTTGPAIALMRYQNRFADKHWLEMDIGGPAGSKFDLIEPLDVDSDGDLDVITCEEVSNLGVIWYENPTLSR